MYVYSRSYKNNQNLSIHRQREYGAKIASLADVQIIRHIKHRNGQIRYTNDTYRAVSEHIFSGSV